MIITRAAIGTMAAPYVRLLRRRLLVGAVAGVVAATLAVIGAGQGGLVSVLLWLVVWVTVAGLLSGLLLYLVARRALRPGPEGRIPAEAGVVYAAISLAGVWVGSIGLSVLVATALTAVLGLTGIVAAVAWIVLLVAAVYLTRVILATFSYTTMITQLRGLSTSDDSLIGRARGAAALRRARPMTGAGDPTGMPPGIEGTAPIRVVSPDPPSDADGPPSP